MKNPYSLDSIRYRDARGGRPGRWLLALAVVFLVGCLVPITVPFAGSQSSLVSKSPEQVKREQEAKRRANNAARLLKLHPWMRPKVKAILNDLESKGFRPVIDGQVHRTPAQQAALKRRGVSKVSYSFHTVTGPKNRPESLAADITDIRWGWNSGRPFWLMLASSAQNHNLSTGIAWGLSKSARGRVGRAILLRQWNDNVPIGFDAAHAQPRESTITLQQARAGKRPH